MTGAAQIIALLAAQGAVLLEEPEDAMRIRIETSPEEVSAFIERRIDCNYLSGAIATANAEREKQLGIAFKKSRCDKIESDERRLRDVHRDRPEVLKLLSATADLMPW